MGQVQHRLLILSTILMLWGCERSPTPTIPPATEAIAITSAAFATDTSIPIQYTCDGGNISPPLRWKSIPPETQSLVLIMDDPDAPGGTFVHWVVYNLPANLNSLDENTPSDETLVFGGLQGKNDFRTIGYGGPCPPSGTHRYEFKLYAVDTMLNLKAGAPKSAVLRAIEGHIVGYGELTGLYTKASSSQE